MIGKLRKRREEKEKEQGENKPGQRRKEREKGNQDKKERKENKTKTNLSKRESERKRNTFEKKTGEGRLTPPNLRYPRTQTHSKVGRLGEWLKADKHGMRQLMLKS